MDSSTASNRFNACGGTSIVCAGCGATIEHPGPRQKHCNARCRTLALRKRLRTMIINRHLTELANELAERKLGPYVPGVREE
jgi:hypothetical protein